MSNLLNSRNYLKNGYYPSSDEEMENEQPNGNDGKENSVSLAVEEKISDAVDVGEEITDAEECEVNQNGGNNVSLLDEFYLISQTPFNTVLFS